MQSCLFVANCCLNRFGLDKNLRRLINEYLSDTPTLIIDPSSADKRIALQHSDKTNYYRMNFKTKQRSLMDAVFHWRKADFNKTFSVTSETFGIYTYGTDGQLTLELFDDYIAVIGEFELTEVYIHQYKPYTIDIKHIWEETVHKVSIEWAKMCW